MEHVVIFNKNGATRAAVTPSQNSQHVAKLMGEDYVQLNFDSPFQLNIVLNDYIIYKERKFTLNTLPVVTKKGIRIYNYECSFEAAIYNLGKVAYLDTDETGIHLSYEFYITGTLEAFLGVIKNNLKRVFGDTAWNCVNTYTGPHNETKTIGFSEDTCLSALRKICTEYSIEYDILESALNGFDRTIYLRLIGGLENSTYDYGKGNGITEVKRVNASESNFITRLYAYGSTDNLGPNYRNFSPRLRLPASMYAIITLINTINKPSILVIGDTNCAFVKLQIADGNGGWVDYGEAKEGDYFNNTYLIYTLPDGGTIPEFRIKGWNNAGGQYVFSDWTYENYTEIDYIENAEAVFQYGVIEKVVIFDDIFPRQKSTITTANAGSIDKFIDINSFNLYEKNSANEYIYVIPNTKPKVHFNSGNLAGYDFEIDNYNHSQHLFTLKKYTDERGMIFPSEESETFQTNVGDEYVLLDIMLPDSHIRDAEERLLGKATEWLEQYSNLSISFDLKFDELFLKANNTYDFSVGNYITVVDTTTSSEIRCRVKEIKTNLIRETDISVTLSEEVYKAQVKKYNAIRKSANSLLKSDLIYNEHERLHAIDSSLDHAPAGESDRGKIVRTNPETGTIELADKYYADRHFEYSQGTPLLSWSIIHNLGKYPSVTITDSSGTELECEVIHNDFNSLTLNFSEPFAGNAYLN